MVASPDKTKLYTIGNQWHRPAYPDLKAGSAASKNIFQFSCENGCVWKELTTKLKHQRYAAVAFPISNELTQKICNSNGKPSITFGTKILVVTGNHGLTTEIIDLGNSKFSCPKVEKFPKNRFYANGGWVGDMPMVCGGVDLKGFHRTA